MVWLWLWTPATFKVWPVTVLYLEHHEHIHVEITHNCSNSNGNHTDIFVYLCTVHVWAPKFSDTCHINSIGFNRSSVRWDIKCNEKLWTLTFLIEGSIQNSLRSTNMFDCLNLCYIQSTCMKTESHKLCQQCTSIQDRGLSSHFLAPFLRCFRGYFANKTHHGKFSPSVLLMPLLLPFPKASVSFALIFMKENGI